MTEGLLSSMVGRGRSRRNGAVTDASSLVGFVDASEEDLVSSIRNSIASIILSCSSEPETTKELVRSSMPNLG